MLNDEDLAFGQDDTDDVIEPQNLLPALDNTTTSDAAQLEYATVPIRLMVTPRRQNEPGTSSAGSQIGSLVEMMVANMMEWQQYIPLALARVESCQHPGAFKKYFRIFPSGENKKMLT